MIYIKSIQGVVQLPKTCPQNESFISAIDSKTGKKLHFSKGLFTQKHHEGLLDKLPKKMHCKSVNFWLANPQTEIERIISEKLWQGDKDEYFEGDFYFGEISEEEAPALNAKIKWY